MHYFPQNPGCQICQNLIGQAGSQNFKQVNELNNPTYQSNAHHILTTEAGNEVRDNEGGRVDLVQAAVEQCVDTFKTSFSELKPIVYHMLKRPQINSPDQFLLKFFSKEKISESVLCFTR